MGSGELRLDLDDGEIGGLVGADNARGPAEVLRIRIGRELDVDLVGLFNDVVVGDDVALGIDDEAGAEGFTDLAIVAAVVEAIFTILAATAAKEALEEILKVLAARTLIFSPAATTPLPSSSPSGAFGTGALRVCGFGARACSWLAVWAEFPC